MAYAIESGIHVSLDNSTWYKLTDHNRSEIQFSPEVIEKSSRMANGTMRKYVIAKKNVISTSWNRVPSQTTYTVDQNKSSEWIEAFYNANVGMPIYVKITRAKQTTPSTGAVPSESTRTTSLNSTTTYQAFITGFSSTVVWRTPDRDFVDMTIEFTEI